MYLNGNENMISYLVSETGITVKEILINRLGISGRLLKKLEKSKSILLNDKIAKINQITGNGDIITIIMEDEEEKNIPQYIPLKIIYEDSDLIIINKQPNIVVHPTKSHVDGTITNGLAYYFKKSNIKKKVRFVNRLDMDTSGVLVAAKNPFGHQQMAKQFDNNMVEKGYLAVVEGVVKDNEEVIDSPIGKDEEDSIKNTVIDNGKKAITKLKVIERYSNFTLVELKIVTGRTHQIRVHLKSIGHPIVGDTLYNKPSEFINRQALHSYMLKFKPPRDDKFITVKAELPDDIKSLIESIK
jgi:23S rRNA pseudouridine1911/1915/1917 synthase